MDPKMAFGDDNKVVIPFHIRSRSLMQRQYSTAEEMREREIELSVCKTA